MTVFYYLHTPLAAGSNEWRPVSRLARFLERHFSQVQIHQQFRLISGAHARIEVQDGAIRILDANSKNGTFVSGRKIDSQQGYLLSPTEKAFLGFPSPKRGVQVWFNLHTTGPVSPEHLYGTLETQDR